MIALAVGSALACGLSTLPAQASAGPGDQGGTQSALRGGGPRPAQQPAGRLSPAFARGPMRGAQEIPAVGLAGSTVRLGAVTGVIDGRGGAALAGVCVQATGPSGSALAVSRPDGRYVMVGLRAGRYLLHYRDCAAPARYFDQWSGGVGLPGQAVTVAVGSGQVRTVPPVMLKPTSLAAASGDGGSQRPTAATRAAGTGRISGVVTGEGRLLRGICVRAYPFRGGSVGRADTSPKGRYTIDGLRPGRYRLQFAGSGCRGTGNWLTQWYRGRTTPYQPSRVTPVRVAAGQTTRGIDASLRLGGQLSGTVTSRSGRRLAGICVAVDPGPGSGGYDAFYDARSRRSGRYVVHGVFPGRYLVQFMIGCGSSGNYAPQWWPHSATARHARLIRVGSGQVRTHVDAALGRGAVISGVVRFRNASGKPLRGICVFLQDGLLNFFDHRTVTARNGSYRLDGLGTGSYVLFFQPGCGNNGNYLDAYRSLTLRAGHTRSGFDAYLQPGAGISGTVTDTHGRPVAGLCVEIDSQGDFGATQTGRDGSYSIGGLTTGSYTVQFTGGCGNRPSYAPQYYDGATDVGSADQVRLTVGTVTAGIGATMRPGGTITGMVTDAAGHRLSHVCVGAVAPAQTLYGFYSDLEFTRDGRYQARNLAPGLYLVNVGCENGSLASQWFKSSSTLGAADLVSVNPGVVTSGINAVMRPAGSITGVVTNRSGRGLYSMCVFLVPRGSHFPVVYTGSEPFTNNAGRYRIGQLPAGRYDVQFFDCDNFRYGSQWYAGRATQAAATPVRVRSGRTTGGISAALAVGGTISGRVVDSSGRPAGVCVSAFDPATDSYGFTFSDNTGYYAMTGLSSGDYSVQFFACGAPEPNVGSVTRPGLVRVVAPHPTKRINARLPTGGSISGRVLGGPPAPRPRSAVCAEVVPVSPDGSSEYTMTRRDGTYIAAHLAPGKYQVYFGDPYCPDASADFAPQWYNGKSGQPTADTVTVLAGHTTSGIGATLLPYGGITGVVTGPSRAPVSGECVTAVPVDAVSSLLFSTDPQPEIALTGPDGSYALMAMLPGRYQVVFTTGCGDSGFAAQWWDGASSAKTATVITVAANVTRTGIDATLRR